MLKTLFFSIWLSFHPVHVTLTSIDYVPEMESFKVFVRMYFDDFLSDIKINGGNIQNQDFKENNSTLRDVMEKYLGEMIIIKVNENQLTGKINDMANDDNEISMNMVYKTINKPKTILVKNLIMTRLYSDQSNMIIVKVNDYEEGVKLTSDITEQTFKVK